MKHLFSCIVLALCLTTFTFADDCSNPLLSVFDFTTTGTPQSGTGLKYCKSLQNGNSCCSSTIIDSIQDKANTLAATLLGNVAQRDQALIDARDNVIPKLQASYLKLKDSYPQLAIQMANPNSPAMTALQQFILSQGAAGNTGSIQTVLTGFLSVFIGPMEQIIDSIYSNLGTVKDQFKTFQSSRSSCAVELLKLQSSAWCLACDPAYASKGVSGATVSMSTRVCNRLQSACYNYVSYTATQGGLLIGKSIASKIEAIATLIEKLTQGDMTGLADLGAVMSSSSGSSTSDAVQGATLPTGCTADGQCSWICTSMFKNGKVDETLAVLGGQAFDASSLGQARRVLDEDEEEASSISVVQTKLQEMRRVLQGGNWDPDQDEAGVTVTFEDDPGNVGNGKGSWGMKMSLIGLFGMLAAIML